MANTHPDYQFQYQYGNTSPTRTYARVPRRSSTQKDLKRVEEEDVVQGRIFWLPPREELPSRAVRRAHGKGAVEEGIYNHPIVVISRPSDDTQTIHFHIVTSFQGKRLSEIYSKSNEFHASRRSWYLPISPSPTHPDANSKKTRKRFPTLDLANDATLRWDSYVNLRHVYRMEWAHLKPYSNPEAPSTLVYQFDRDSMIRLLAKSKQLTNYEPGPQRRSRSTPIIEIPAQPTTTNVRPYERETMPTQSPVSDTDCISVISRSSEYSGLSPILQSDFGSAGSNEERSIPKPPKAPPDRNGVRGGLLRRVLWLVLEWLQKLGRWVLNRPRR